MAQKQLPNITVRELKQLLSAHPDDMELDFSTLDFYRLKRRGPNVIQVEFNQIVYRDEQGNVCVDNPD
ncbi:MAG: hypothetical protein OIF55_19225 [Amphritea sp.]|nr:hypothetical protein [Amphritea sp.]